MGASDADLFSLYISQAYPVEVHQYTTGEGRGVRATMEIDSGVVVGDYHGESDVMTAAEFELLKESASSEKLL